MDWTFVDQKVETEAYLPDEGEKIGTLNGVETAGPNTVVVRHRHSDSDEWAVFVTDRDTFDSRYDHDLFGDEIEEDQVNQDFTATVEAADSVLQAKEEAYWNQTVPELRTECENRELETSGNKADLIARLVEYDRTNQS